MRRFTKVFSAMFAVIMLFTGLPLLNVTFL